MLLRLVFYTICKWWNKSLRNVGSMRRCGFKRSEIYEVQQFQFLFHHILQLPFHHILRHLHFSRELFRPDLELFWGILRHSDLCHTSFEALCVSSTSLLTQWKGWGLSAKLGTHSAIWGKLGTALHAYILNPCTKFPPNPTSRKVNT